MTSRDRKDAENWLYSHGIIGYDDLIDNSLDLPGDDLKQRQFKLTRSKSPVEFYVDSDPTMCAWVFEKNNVTSLLFVSPGFVRVEDRPDAPSKVRKWSDIEASIERVNIAKSKEASKPTEQDFWAEDDE